MVVINDHYRTSSALMFAEQEGPLMQEQG